MSIMVITGQLGSGKTLSLTYLAYRNFLKGKTIYANYTLKEPIKYIRLMKISDLLNMRNGFFAGDEFWIELDTQTSSYLRRRIVNDILRRSRKRGVDCVITSQTMNQIPPRIAKVLDFIAFPILNRDASVCKLTIMNGPKPTIVLKRIWFLTKPIFNMYDTNEEVSELLDDITGSKGLSQVVYKGNVPNGSNNKIINDIQYVINSLVDISKSEEKLEHLKESGALGYLKEIIDEIMEVEKVEKKNIDKVAESLNMDASQLESLTNQKI